MSQIRRLLAGSISQIRLLLADPNSSTIVENPLQIGLFMQNKPNFQNAPMHLSAAFTSGYEGFRVCPAHQNNPKTNPIKPKTNPIKANFHTTPRPASCRQIPAIANGGGCKTPYFISVPWFVGRIRIEKAPYNAQGALASVRLKRQVGQISWPAAIRRQPARNRGS